MAYQNVKQFNETLSAFLEENDLLSSFIHWMEWDAGSSILEKVVKADLDKDYAEAEEAGYIEEFIKITRRTQGQLIRGLNSSSSSEANRANEIRLKSITSWLQRKEDPFL